MILKDNDWLKKYIFWELELLKLLGYDLELDNLVLFHKKLFLFLKVCQFHIQLLFNWK